ncbi:MULTISPECIES: amidase [unclassified Pseudonocardia]|uniref:amidase n=1 Tax=unclassified Pseudonocardia TaxID=2619320 RepID=UPI0001FFF2EB|nr:amidase [Pseudonocardia sp. Ae707_Ps1]OLM21111.1 putative amidase [Pseudonocardia sp. Ae707_Ps1]
MSRRVHAFSDDALGDDDAVGLADRVRRGEVSPAELRAAVAARVARVEPELHGLALDRTTEPVTGSAGGPLAGVPTLVKDNTEVRGWPSANGTTAYTATPSREHSEVTRQLLATGLDAVGVSRMPEYGLNASTEFADAEPTRNPWDPRYSAGASSGGSAALVAAGVVPIAHANDGGGSIRIPAAACGLVGLKPSRGRIAQSANGARMPIDLVTDGVVSRSVRDTATFLAAADRHRRNPSLPPVGLVEGPARRRLRIGLVLDSPTGATVDEDTRTRLAEVAELLGKQGHEVSGTTTGVGQRFVDDFLDYWGLLAFSVVTGGRWLHGRTFDPDRLDALTHGLADHYRHVMARTPVFLHRLRRVERTYAELFTRHDVLLSPVLAHTPPEIGWLSPRVPFDDLRARLLDYVAFTPLCNVAGAPAISLPAGAAGNGLPVGVHLSTALGDERTLLELAFALEADRPWRRIQD